MRASASTPVRTESGVGSSTKVSFEAVMVQERGSAEYGAGDSIGLTAESTTTTMGGSGVPLSGEITW